MDARPKESRFSNKIEFNPKVLNVFFWFKEGYPFMADCIAALKIN